MSAVMMYHSVSKSPVSPTLQVTLPTLLNHLTWVEELGYQWVPLEAALTHPSDKLVALTFDDGFADVIHAVDAVLSRAGSMVMFICPGKLGCHNDWCTDVSFRAPLLGREDIQQLAHSGVTLGCHTWAHSQLTLMSCAEIRTDLERCNEWFRTELGSSPSYFAYPYGAWNQSIARIAAEYYQAAVAVEPTLCSSVKFAVPRVACIQGMSFECFDRELSRLTISRWEVNDVA